MHLECLFLEQFAHHTPTITNVMQFHLPIHNYRPSSLERGSYRPHGLISERRVRTAKRFWDSLVVFGEKLVCGLKETETKN